jgi:hypothetical protein
MFCFRRLETQLQPNPLELLNLCCVDLTAQPPAGQAAQWMEVARLGGLQAAQGTEVARPGGLQAAQGTEVARPGGFRAVQRTEDQRLGLQATLSFSNMVS